jgi:hypothetical protein
MLHIFCLIIGLSHETTETPFKSMSIRANRYRRICLGTLEQSYQQKVIVKLIAVKENGDREKERKNQKGHLVGAGNLLIQLAPQVRLELTTLRLTE